MIERVAEYDGKYHRWRRVTQQDAERLDAAGEAVIEVPSAPRIHKLRGEAEQVTAAASDYFAPPEALLRHGIPEATR